eukprot:COSAG04_NODE_4091_length_2304_cov_1210.369112_4_plen_48_part_01
MVQESVVILTRNTTTVPVDERTGGLIFGEGGCTIAILSRFCRAVRLAN